MNTPSFNSPADAEAAFYEALARADLDAMMAVWSEEDEIVCIHPEGPRLVGLNAVREAWRQMFAGGARLNIRTSHLVASSSMLLAVHNLIEHIAVEGDDQLNAPLLATNVFARGPHGWKMVLHHVSPAPEISPVADTFGPRVVH